MEELFSFIIAGLVEALFGVLVFVPIGFIWLYSRYRNTQIVEDILAREYDNSYANAGQVVVLNTVAAIGILLVLALLFFAPLAHWLHN
ncbi:hypothetical protein SAMN06265337_1377 [Hymenobacter gelipurpurascens]|uniref:Uncharacterized protein n=1 Tax=Hymenobacter gelipurpurascens TaxID=89968 RepID=A0A212TI68_9BACT|nr:hypothetical protein [Hymenobacter gelipurpurascens]SNC65747.1 hypothetical protein SAMN06265337_1377 [Hymenobacter gelipurpurascens]